MLKTNAPMSKPTKIIFPFLLLNSVLGFSQIPNFPTPQQPNPNTVYGTPKIEMPSTDVRNLMRVPQTINVENDRLRQQNELIIKQTQQDIKQRTEERKQQEYYNKLQKEEQTYFLPSLSDKTGTKAYYTAFDHLSTFNPENYSIADATFLVENAFYNNIHKNFPEEFQNNIQKAVNTIKNEIIKKGIDQNDNTAKNMILFKYFAEDSKQNGKVVHKSIKYDFEDYMGAKDYSKMFVSKLMKTGKGQCHSMPLFYLILAEQIGAEAYLSMSPNHSYIRFTDDEGMMRNVELTNGMFSTNSYILQSGYIKSEALQNKLYMQNLSKKDLLSQTYVDLASGYIHKFGYDEFVAKVLDRALELNPNNITATLWKSNTDQMRFQNACKQMGINPMDKNDLQNIRNYPNLVGQLRNINTDFDKIDNSGFAMMPPEAYEKWLGSMKGEVEKQKSQEIAEKIKTQNLQKQKEEQERLEKQKQEQKPIQPKTPEEKAREWLKKPYQVPKSWKPLT